ncbi:MAG: hypothetical protein JNM07_03740 [Phycisphaerae bacterium]|nr:hypothetical protein [Phycisphaerae bacterium]
MSAADHPGARVSPPARSAEAARAPGPVPVVVALCVVAVIGGTFLATSGTPLLRGLGVLALIAVGVLGVGTLIVAQSRAERARRAALAETLDAAGFVPVFEPSQEQRAQLFAHLAHLPNFQNAGRSVRWFARGEVDGSPVTLLEYTHVVSTGKHTHTVVLSVAAAPCPESWPLLTLKPEGFLHRVGEIFGVHDLRLDSDAFNRRWRVSCEREDFALLALSPEAQQWLLAAPRAEQWTLGGPTHAIAAVRIGMLGPADALEFLRRPVEFMEHMPDELWNW